MPRLTKRQRIEIHIRYRDGWTVTDLAREYKFTRDTIYHWINTESFSDAERVKVQVRHAAGGGKAS